MSDIKIFEKANGEMKISIEKRTEPEKKIPAQPTLILGFDGTIQIKNAKEINLLK